jgi:hypothetical protein
MNVFYGYNVHQDAAAGLDCERVYIDTPKTKRSELEQMIDLGLRPGDTVIVRHDAHIPRTMTARKAVEAIATIKVVEPVKTPRKPGPRAEYAPTGDDKARQAAIWFNLGYTTKGALARMTEAHGAPVKRNAAYRAFGKRGM